jgi:hypothetical protein
VGCGNLQRKVFLYDLAEREASANNLLSQHIEEFKRAMIAPCSTGQTFSSIGNINNMI